MTVSEGSLVGGSAAGTILEGRKFVRSSEAREACPEAPPAEPEQMTVSEESLVGGSAAGLRF